MSEVTNVIICWNSTCDESPYAVERFTVVSSFTNFTSHRHWKINDSNFLCNV